MKKQLGQRGGFSLVEVTLALGIATFALTTMLALMAVGLNTSQASLPKTSGINITSQIYADLRETPTATAIIASGSTLTTVSARYGIDISQASTTLYLDESGALLSSGANARYKATISLTNPTSGKRNATYGKIVISWPALAASPTGSVSTFIALDRN